MRRSIWPCLAAVALGSACNDNERGIHAATDTGGASDATSASETADAADDGTGGADGTDDATQPPIETTTTSETTPVDIGLLPNGCDATHACQKGVCRSGVCVEDPPANEVSHTTDPTSNAPTTEWPDLSCADHTAEAPIQTQTATLHGAVSRFGKGRETYGVRVDVLLAGGFDPSACAAETDAAQVACYRAAGTQIGTATSAEPPADAVLPDVCTDHAECPLGWQCDDPNELGGVCKREFGLYEIPGVPLETPLILRAYVQNDTGRWHDTWIFHVVLHASEVVAGRVQYDAQMVSEGQWILTPNSVGMTSGIPLEHGVIGGRIRDCEAAGEDAWPIANVRLNLANKAVAIVYFNNLEDDTVPLIERETTDILGRFAALDVEPGWNIISGSARVESGVVSIGSAPVYVFPNALSIVSWPGSQPYWRQD